MEVMQIKLGIKVSELRIIKPINKIATIVFFVTFA